MPDSRKPLPWSEAAKTGSLKGIRGVCFDIDDTFSSEGKITDEAYHALWSLQRAGFALAPITGRPAGWCDHIARFWPVDAVVGENGAFTFFLEGGKRRRLATPGADPAGPKKLEALGKTIRARFPHATWASDQAYREFDLAIDICEDVAPWKSADVDALLELCHAEGAHAKLSSIHVNTWYGDFDKRKGFRAWIEAGAPGTKARADWKPSELDGWIYIGDSPNDEPMFELFRHSVGVANLGRYLDRLKHPPKWMTAAESGAGFAEMARALIQNHTIASGDQNR